jgi:hypothetical protein
MKIDLSYTDSEWAVMSCDDNGVLIRIFVYEKTTCHCN